MKKETRKEAHERELKFLSETGLTRDELATIRKLNGATSVPGYEGSRRTVEAVLQGRRTNVSLLQRAIHNAKDQLDILNREMQKILEKLGRL